MKDMLRIWNGSSLKPEKYEKKDIYSGKVVWYTRYVKSEGPMELWNALRAQTA